MKALGAILFSLFFLLTTMQEATFMLLYKLNEKSITEKYCVNKNVAGSCCKGSCHLNKTISKAENEDSKNPFSTLNIKVKEIEIFFSEFNKIHEIISVVNSTCNRVEDYIYDASLEDGCTSSLIKPPAFLG